MRLNTVVVVAAAVEVAKVGAVGAAAVAVEGVAAATVGGAGGDDVSSNAASPDPNPPINYCDPTVPDCLRLIFAPAA